MHLLLQVLVTGQITSADDLYLDEERSGDYSVDGDDDDESNSGSGSGRPNCVCSSCIFSLCG